MLGRVLLALTIAAVAGASPYVITGVRQSFGRAWISVVGAELLSGTKWGLGRLIFDSREFLRTDMMIVALLTIGAIGVFFETVVFRFVDARTVLRWRMCRAAAGARCPRMKQEHLSMFDKSNPPAASRGRRQPRRNEPLGLGKSATDAAELRHLRYFLAVARTKSFTRAAEQLHISQPTLSHQIRQLEERLGTRLLHRFARHAELTPAGEAFKPHCERMLNELSDGITAVAELEGLVRGSLRLAVFHSFSSSMLGPVLADFALRYPGVHVVARLLPRVEMERELLAGALDLAVAYAYDAEHIVAETLFEEELVLIVGRRHALARRASIPMRALADLSLVLLTEEFGARQFVERFFAREKLTPNVVLEMNAIEPILSTIRQPPLATVLSRGVISSRSELHAVRLTRPTPKRSCAILWRRDGYRPVAANRMAEMIRAAYRPQPQGRS